MLLWTTTAHDTKRRWGGEETYKVRKQKTVLKLIPGKKMETSAATTKATFIATFTIPHMPAQADQNTSSVRPWNVRHVLIGLFFSALWHLCYSEEDSLAAVKIFITMHTKIKRGVSLKSLQEMPTMVSQKEINETNAQMVHCSFLLCCCCILIVLLSVWHDSHRHKHVTSGTYIW